MAALIENADGRIEDWETGERAQEHAAQRWHDTLVARSPAGGYKNKEVVPRGGSRSVARSGARSGSRSAGQVRCEYRSRLAHSQA